MKQYDLVVLGSGSAGHKVAKRCRDAGWKVAVVNDDVYGGTCPTRGCIPKKVLSGTAEIADINRRLHELGLMKEQPAMNWGEMIQLKRSFTEPVSPRTKQSLLDDDIDVYEGRPKFSGNLELEVGDQQLSAKKVHIAVGAKPAKLPVEGAEYLITSDDFLELDDLPKRVIFVGGGYVSFELAHVAARFGAEVTILHGDEQPLSAFDPDIIQTLLAASKEAGIRVELNAKVEKLEKQNGSFAVSAGGDSFEADLVVNGAGRPPAVLDLNLEAANVEYDKRRGVLVDEYLRSTSNPDVTAAGDAAASGPPLSPVAGRQGTVVADNLLGKKDHKQPSYLATPSAIFTTPPVGKVGYLEAEAKEKGLDFEAKITDVSTFFDAKRQNLKHAKSKILVEKGTDKILGAHLIGSHAEDLINIFGLAIEYGLTTGQLKAPIFVFPTSGDDLRSMF